jgi:Amt family ammonium transporter
MIAGLTTWYACAKLKARFGYDDALDTFGVHAIGGTFGTILAGVFASAEANPNLQGLLSSGRTLWLEQLKAAGIVLVWSIVVTYVLYVVINKTIGCRVHLDTETQGLDLAEHGEEGYIE